MDELLKQFKETLVREIVTALIPEIKNAVRDEKERESQNRLTAASTASGRRYYTDADVAKLLGKSEQTIRRWRYEKRINHTYDGKTPVFTDVHLEEYFERHDTMPKKKREEIRLRLVA